MPTSLPFELLVAWTLMFGFINTHQRHAKHFRGDSKTFRSALDLPFILGGLAAISLLIFYFFQVAWYWPIVLFIVSTLLGGLIFGALDVKLGVFNLSVLGFIGWPASAAWSFFVIRHLAP